VTGKEASAANPLGIVVNVSGRGTAQSTMQLWRVLAYLMRMCIIRMTGVWEKVGNWLTQV